MGNESLVIDDLVDNTISSTAATSNSFFQSLPVDVTLEVSSTEMTLSELSKLGHGDVVQLQARAGDPINIKVNGQLLGRGEVVDVDGRYGVRMLEVFAKN
ncbi:FliM/FliN family flagellar motor switch protein [Ferrimonas lipolytica]|uniref:Flagellar motor switch protein FliN n=1 Tax=Ferrimonas lipolytica TaxID=2724191 RepID=A0A6H1UG69_9GAMM|nr:FliM/FliN family flagellar motor switch protein [Ferrimonas lipolytica]QIZ76792.1 flagellar motor switch protein FliN [Ferrimonas lipolytica]